LRVIHTKSRPNREPRERPVEYRGAEADATCGFVAVQGDDVVVFIVYDFPKFWSVCVYLRRAKEVRSIFTFGRVSFRTLVLSPSDRIQWPRGTVS
jgi:hypothetical protein